MIALWLFTVVRSVCQPNAPCALPKCGVTLFSDCYCGSSSNICNSNQYCNGGVIFQVCGVGLATASCMCNSSFCNKDQYCNGGIVSSGPVGVSVGGCVGGGCGSSIVVSTGCVGGGCGVYNQICQIKCSKYKLYFNFKPKKYNSCLRDCYDLNSSDEDDDSNAQESSDEEADEAKEAKRPGGQGMPHQGMRPQGMPPQQMQHQGMPPQGMPPHGMQPHGMPPREEKGSPMPMILLAGAVVLILLICGCAASVYLMRLSNNAGDAGDRAYEASAGGRRSLAVEQARASKAMSELMASRMTRPADSFARPADSFARPADSFARPARYNQPKKSGVSITSLVLGRNSSLSSKRHGNKERRGRSSNARNDRTGRSTSRRGGRTSVKK